MEFGSKIRTKEDQPEAEPFYILQKLRTTLRLKSTKTAQAEVENYLFL